MLNGKKTYLVSIGIIASAVGMWLQGQSDLGEAIQAVLTGLGLAALRHGVTTEK